MTVTNIQWAQHVWNPIVGCTHKAPRKGARPVWTGRMAAAPDETWLTPLRRKKPTRYFVNSMGDLFHPDVPDEWRDRAFAVMALAPQHVFIVLTKRGDVMRDYMTSEGVDEDGFWFDREHRIASRAASLALSVNVKGYTDDPRWPLPNVWLGVTAENQEQADARIPDLLATPAAKRLVSVEPMLGAVSLAHIRHPLHRGAYIDALDALDGHVWHEDGYVSLTDHPNQPALDWVICGGESGPGARNPDFADHARALRDQCRSAGVAFFGKQDFGGKPMPADLDITEFPA